MHCCFDGFAAVTAVVLVFCGLSVRLLVGGLCGVCYLFASFDLWVGGWCGLVGWVWCLFNLVLWWVWLPVFGLFTGGCVWFWVVCGLVSE